MDDSTRWSIFKRLIAGDKHQTLKIRKIPDWAKLYEASKQREVLNA